MRRPFRLYNIALPVVLLGLPVAIAGGWWMLPKSVVDRGRQLLGQQSGEKITYNTVAVDKGEIRKVVSTSGPVRALVTVAIGSQISGQIESLKVDFNSEVKAGDVLAVIDNRTFEARVAQSRADLLAAQAALAIQEAAVKRSQAVSEQAERNLTRQKTLQQKGYAATATLDTANRDIEVAAAEQESAVAQIASAKAVIVQREASLKQAEIDLDRTRIIAPINGTVISRTIDVGQTVAASLQAPELFKIAQDLRRIRIESQVNEADVGQVQQDNPATFTVDAYPDRTFQGKVTQVRLSATELQNVITYTVIIEASNDDRKLFPGMTANVQIEVSKKDSVLRVPNDALRFKPRADASAGRNDRGERMITRLKGDIQLTDAQEQVVRDELKKVLATRTSAPGGVQTDIADPSAMRQRMQAAVEQTLTPLLTAEQQPLFEKWKRGRENSKNGGVHVLNAQGQLERRFVRLGIADDRFTEIESGQLAEGDRVVIRATDVEK
jgi:HlyD family secretion protein